MAKIDELIQNIKGWKSAQATLKPNYMLIPITRIEPTAENAPIFNELLKEAKKLNKINRTKSGGISWKRLRLPAYDYNNNSNCVELVILSDRLYRIQFRNELYKDNRDKILSGRKAFIEFKAMARDFGIDFDNYAIDNGKEINAQTEKYIIKAERESILGMTFENVHHIDFHSSFPAGLANTHPEFSEFLNYLYDNRKKDEKYKAYLNYSIGFMHSKLCGYKYAQLSHDAINDNNARVRDLAERLRKSGRVPLLYNTDGIWYSGEIFHDYGEGDKLGDWRNDHINCKFRAKSKGSYEFIEDGKYTPVVRGATNLDKIKNRSEWQWGDIFNATVIQFYVDDEGVHYYE